MNKSRSKIIKKLRHSVPQKPMLVNVWCSDGPCKGEVFQMTPDAAILRIVTPANHCYKMVNYAITSGVTPLGERMGVFMSGVSR